VERRTVVRDAARVILVDANLQVLLFRFSLGAGWSAENGRPHVWITPGGGLNPGETHERCARRELWEETGIELEPGPCVWTRSHTFRWGEVYVEQRERYFVAHCAAPEISTQNWTPEESVMLSGHQWWSQAEIADSAEAFAPRRLGELLLPILAGEYPAEPFDTGP